LNLLKNINKLYRMKNVLPALVLLLLTLISFGQNNKPLGNENQFIDYLDSINRNINQRKNLSFKKNEYEPAKDYNYYLNYNSNYETSSKKKKPKIKCKKIDSLNILLPKTNINRHGLGIGYGLSGLFSQGATSNYDYLVDDFLVLSYRYLIPLEITQCKSKFIFLNTSQNINFLTIINKYKKFSHLGTIEVGLQRKSEFIFNYYIALGVANYWYFTSSPIYFINDADELNDISNYNSRFVTLRLGKRIKKSKLLHFDFLFLFNTQKNKSPKFNIGFNFNLMPYFNFRK